MKMVKRSSPPSPLIDSSPHLGLIHHNTSLPRQTLLGECRRMDMLILSMMSLMVDLERRQKRDSLVVIKNQ
jgi:hypothetical protein